MGRKINISRERSNQILLFAIFFLAFLGYYSFLVGLFSLGLGGLSRQVTIPLRIIVSLLLIVYLTFNWYKLRVNLNMLYFSAFSSAYLLRLIIDYFLDSDYYMSIPEVLLFFISFCVIPFWGIISKPIARPEIKGIIYALIYSGLLFAVFTIALYGRFIGAVTRLTENTAGESVISPLALSYCSSLIIGVFTFYLLHNKTKIITRIVMISAIVLSVVPFFLGASRGSLVALFVSFFVYFLHFKGFYDFFRRFVFGILIACGLIFLDAYLESGLVSRLLATSEAVGTNDGSAIRLLIWKNALNQFIENPILGSGLKVDSWDGYAHNLFIEALQTTGLLGTVPLIMLVCNAWRAGFKIAKTNKQYFWVVALFVQSFSQSMFSGAIYTSSWLWFSLATVLVINRTLIKERRLYSFNDKALFVKG